MFCTKCGTPVENGQPFCPSCGAPIGTPMAPPPPMRQPRPANPKPFNLGLVFLFVTLGCLFLSAVLCFFATGFHLNIPAEYRSYLSSSQLQEIVGEIGKFKLPFLSTTLILALNIFAAAWLVMPLIGVCKKNAKLSFLALVSTGTSLLVMIINWITISSLFRGLSEMGSGLGSMLGSSSLNDYLGFGLNVFGVFALLLQMTAVAGCVMLFLGDRKPAERKPRPRPAPQYAPAPQFQPAPQYQHAPLYQPAPQFQQPAQQAPAQSYQPAPPYQSPQEPL